MTQDDTQNGRSGYRFDLIHGQMQTGHYSEAIESLKSVLSDDPESAAGHALLASCLMSLGRLHAAGHELGLALQLAPNVGWFHLLGANLDVLRNRPRQALDHCRQALELDPQQASAHLLMSDIHRQLGDNIAALDELDTAAGLEPNSPRLASAYGSFYQSTGELDKALSHASDALALNAGDIEANLLMGRIRLARGEAEEAEYHAKFVILQSPSSEAALRLLSHIKMRRSWFLGLWWRLNTWINGLGNTRAALALILAYLFFSLLSRVVLDLGYPGASGTISLGWLLLALYSWISIPMYHKALKKELEQFRFNKNF